MRRQKSNIGAVLGAGLTWCAKDIDTAQEMAEVGVELPAAALSRRLMPAIIPATIRDLFG